MALPMVKPLLGTAVGLQSLALVGVAASSIPDFSPKGMKKMNYKKQTGKMLKSGTGLLIGIPLVGATAGMVNAL